jgi:hypothetical protein
MNRLRVILVLMLFSAGFGIGATSACAAPAGPEALLREGLKLRKNGDDAAALEKFQQAAALERSGRALAQIALAEQALGRWVEAEAHLGEALAVKNDAWIERNRSLLVSALGDIGTHLGDLEVVGNVHGALVRVNGTERGRLPLAQPLRVPVGTITLEVQAHKHFPLVRSVSIMAQGRSRESVTMVPEPTEVAREADPVPTRSLVATADDAPGPAESAWPWQKSAGVAALAGAGAFLILGGVSTTLEWLKYKDAKASGCGRNSTNDTCKPLLQDMASHHTRAIVGYTGAAVLGATGGLMLWLSPTVNPGVDTALTLDLSGRF